MWVREEKFCRLLLTMMMESTISRTRMFHWASRTVKARPVSRFFRLREVLGGISRPFLISMVKFEVPFERSRSAFHAILLIMTKCGLKPGCCVCSMNFTGTVRANVGPNGVVEKFSEVLKSPHAHANHRKVERQSEVLALPNRNNSAFLNA